MTADMVAELLRQLMREALILAAPILVIAALLSFVLSLVQTLTSFQDQPGFSPRSGVWVDVVWPAVPLVGTSGVPGPHLISTRGCC